MNAASMDRALRVALFSCWAIARQAGASDTIALNDINKGCLIKCRCAILVGAICAFIYTRCASTQRRHLTHAIIPVISTRDSIYRMVIGIDVDIIIYKKGYRGNLGYRRFLNELKIQLKFHTSSVKLGTLQTSVFQSTSLLATYYIEKYLQLLDLKIYGLCTNLFKARIRPPLDILTTKRPNGLKFRVVILV